MRFLFIHQNFPGQFRYIARALANDKTHEVVAIGDGKFSNAKRTPHPSIRIITYQSIKQDDANTHHYLRELSKQVRQGQAAARALLQLARQGFIPDTIIAHSGWGETLFIEEIFPNARIVNYCEFFYRSSGADLGFDPEFPSSLNERCRAKLRNSVPLIALHQADVSVTATHWQKSLVPAVFHPRINVIHEGIDTELLHPDANACLRLNGEDFHAGEQVVTFATRALEPYRGFHRFMQALPSLQRALPEARFIIAGREAVSYGKSLPGGESYKHKYCLELQDKVDWTRVHFAGLLEHSEYRKLLQVSAAHVYFTYPFVLSWSLLDAMASGCIVVGSATAPVQEVITHEHNGLLVDFFDEAALVAQVQDVVLNPQRYLEIRRRARETIRLKYGLKQCLDSWLALLLEHPAQ